MIQTEWCWYKVCRVFVNHYYILWVDPSFHSSFAEASVYNSLPFLITRPSNRFLRDLLINLLVSVIYLLSCMLSINVYKPLNTNSFHSACHSSFVSLIFPVIYISQLPFVLINGDSSNESNYLLYKPYGPSINDI